MNLAQWVCLGAIACAVLAGLAAALAPDESDEREGFTAYGALLLCCACFFAAVGHAQQIGLLE